MCIVCLEVIVTDKIRMRRQNNEKDCPEDLYPEAQNKKFVNLSLQAICKIIWNICNIQVIQQ